MHAQATVSNRNTVEGALLEQPRSRQTPQEVLNDSLLRHVEITGDFDFLKITTTETTFLPVKSTAESQHARTSNERNKVAPQVKCSWKRNKPMHVNTARIPTSCIVAVKICLSLPWWCQVCSHMKAHFSFLLLLFLFLFAPLANFLSALNQQLLPLPLRVS